MKKGLRGMSPKAFSVASSSPGGCRLVPQLALSDNHSEPLQRASSSAESSPNGEVKRATAPNFLATRSQTTTGREPFAGALQRSPVHFHRAPSMMSSRGSASGAVSDAKYEPPRGAAWAGEETTPAKASDAAKTAAESRRAVTVGIEGLHRLANASSAKTGRKRRYTLRFATYDIRFQVATENAFYEPCEF